MKIEIRTRYGSDDPEFKYDYYAVDIYINDQLIKSYGDDYHDKGYEKACGWLDGFIAGHAYFRPTGYFTVDWIKVADYIV